MLTPSPLALSYFSSSCNIQRPEFETCSSSPIIPNLSPLDVTSLTSFGVSQDIIAVSKVLVYDIKKKKKKKKSQMSTGHQNKQDRLF